MTGETSLPEKDSNQKVYDAPLNKRIVDSLLNDGSQNEVSTARLLAASKKESGQWLNAYLIPNLGLNCLTQSCKLPSPSDWVQKFAKSLNANAIRLSTNSRPTHYRVRRIQVVSHDTAQ